jgi:hypothetical protein
VKLFVHRRSVSGESKEAKGEATHTSGEVQSTFMWLFFDCRPITSGLCRGKMVTVDFSLACMKAASLPYRGEKGQWEEAGKGGEGRGAYKARVL